ncbi:anti-sigma regulatory factor (Ser/Thr protein kinase) [Streptomyces calvus]|uniref:histidine kinase n=2 Tax=Streptomyces calvus TaxID=67282 RepID=A0AA40VJW7_9ACTN|nr:anti-sigma regulatory factor (Ser/Thr protein kinase) [Streptomyces calvus]
MQALATGMLADLRAMEDKHHDEEVLADLLHLDHRTAQAGRLADSVAVLTGARSGRRWARPIAMESILRGAMGRIGGYQRVRAHSASDTAVAGHAAEGVMHALAELLDNAANFSPPTAEVHVYVEEVPSGIIVSVEDSGLVMSDVQLRRAERAVSGESTDLGGLTGTRLGLAVVGRLARRYGLKVSYRPSARGGTSALMLIPQELLVTTGASAPESTGTAPAATSSATTARAGEATATTATAPAGEATTTPATTATAATAAIAARTAPAIPSEEPAAAAARAADRPAPPAEPTAEPTSAGLPRRRSSRTKPAPAAPDHRHDPVPEHESAAPDGEAPPLVLPRRRRGRTLADAERTWSAGRTADPRPAPTAEETRARTARFSSFRRAVRPTTAAPTGDDAPARPATAPTAPTADDVRAGRDTDTPPAAQNNPTTPEGDTTS